jgi:transcriptional regulator with XRE-family HTH domain
MKLDSTKVLQAREQLGLSIAEVAENAEVSPNSVSRAENDKEIRPLTARRIARALGVEVADLYPKGVAPTSSPKPDSEEERRAATLIDLSQEEFLRALSEASAAGAEALVQLYNRIDAERTSAELAFRADESNRVGRAKYARAVERRMMVFLSLVERGVSLQDPEQLSLQAEQLEELQLLH